MTLSNTNGRDVEEVLEAIWTCVETRDQSVGALKACCHVPVDEPLLSRLEGQGLLLRQGDQIDLTDEGRRQAAQVVRRHRLAERLLVDILNIPVQQAEEGACEFEHILAPQVTESICTLLGHPQECPHGAPIPKGPCCLAAKDVVDSMVVPLTRVDAGRTARVAYIGTRSHSRLHKLMSFGLAPGVKLKVHQKSPSFVISYGQTELALEQDVAQEICVWRDSRDGSSSDV
jgi:DtxR family transcriptional regulator, Mn-dependent transcriptional regulator